MTYLWSCNFATYCMTSMTSVVFPLFFPSLPHSQSYRKHASSKDGLPRPLVPCFVTRMLARAPK